MDNRLDLVDNSPLLVGILGTAKIVGKLVRKPLVHLLLAEYKFRSHTTGKHQSSRETENAAMNRATDSETGAGL